MNTTETRAFEDRLRLLVSEKKPIEFIEAVLRHAPRQLYRPSMGSKGATTWVLRFYGGAYDGKGISLCWAQHGDTWMPACGATLIEALQIANTQVLEVWERRGFPKWDTDSEMPQ